MRPPSKLRTRDPPRLLGRSELVLHRLCITLHSAGIRASHEEPHLVVQPCSAVWPHTERCVTGGGADEWPAPAIDTPDPCALPPIPGDTEPDLDVFKHGVASGDPLTDRVIIWTRVEPSSPEPGHTEQLEWIVGPIRGLICR